MKREGRGNGEHDVVVLRLHKRAVNQRLVEIEDKRVGRNAGRFGREEERLRVGRRDGDVPETSLCGVEDIECVQGDFGQLLLRVTAVLVFVEARVQLAGSVKKRTWDGHRI